MSSPRKPVLGMILKGYPRISETFISNEILLLEKLGFSIHIFSMRNPRDMRNPREPFSHKNVKDIQASVDYLPQTIIEALPQLLYHNFMLALRIHRRYGNAIKVACRRFL
ncbi:MAG: colanic acid biosynthesis glycosyltransferase WcaL, partial [Deltaproteobacteria bacterium]|nr:colanic acid biosynthesis glycosyltransferase WcaL [Deltaproteobacteria bacterium]